MDSLDYKKLYSLQDRVLDCVFECENEFYLTGGTCLGRFYQEKRYSDDLDFFTNNSSRYSFAVKNIKQTLQKNFDLNVKVESKSFIRFKIDDLLQIDFVNDIAARYKDVKVLENNYIIDNVENILSNKLTAVIGRDNPKDIFDIYLISKFYTFSWEDILNSAHEKAGFNNEDLIIRLKSFPVNLLERVNIIDTNFLNNFEDEFMTIIEDISNISV
jgi:predicted nucleotidyltransferase component of viral defense system